jgi:hypothetical protein
MKGEHASPKAAHRFSGPRLGGKRRLLSLLFFWLFLALGIPSASAAERDATLGFGWQYLVPALGPARNLDPGFGPVVSFSFASEGSRLAFLARSGIWHFVGGRDDEIAVSLAPFLAGGEYTAFRRGRVSVVGQLLVGGVWLKVRSTEGEADPPFEEARFTDRSLRLAGSATLLLRVVLTKSMSIESGVAVDLLYFEESDQPGFVGVPLSLVARF